MSINISVNKKVNTFIKSKINTRIQTSGQINNHFNWETYLSQYTDLYTLKTKNDAAKHFHSFGKNEGRLMYVYSKSVDYLLNEICNIYCNQNIAISDNDFKKFFNYLKYVDNFIKEEYILETTDGFYINKISLHTNTITDIYPYKWANFNTRLPIKKLPEYLSQMLKKNQTFKHSGDLGDIIFSLPTIRDLGGGILYLNTSGERYLGETTKFNSNSFATIKDLLLTQFYIHDVKEYTKDINITFNLDIFAEPINKQTKRLSVPELFCTKFNVDTINLNFEWLHVESIFSKKIICARGLRNRCNMPYIDPTIVANASYDPKHDKVWKQIVDIFKNELLFVGLEADCEDFINKFGKVDYYVPNNLLNLAEIINGSNLVICNCSLTHAIAEGLKKPLLLEISGHPAGYFYRNKNMWTFTNEDIDIGIVTTVIKNFILLPLINQ